MPDSFAFSLRVICLLFPSNSPPSHLPPSACLRLLVGGGGGGDSEGCGPLSGSPYGPHTSLKFGPWEEVTPELCAPTPAPRDLPPDPRLPTPLGTICFLLAASKSEHVLAPLGKATRGKGTSARGPLTSFPSGVTGTFSLACSRPSLRPASFAPEWRSGAARGGTEQAAECGAVSRRGSPLQPVSRPARGRCDPARAASYGHGPSPEVRRPRGGPGPGDFRPPPPPPAPNRQDCGERRRASSAVGRGLRGSHAPRRQGRDRCWCGPSWGISTVSESAVSGTGEPLIRLGRPPSPPPHDSSSPPLPP